MVLLGLAFWTFWMLFPCIKFFLFADHCEKQTFPIIEQQKQTTTAVWVLTGKIPTIRPQTIFQYMQMLKYEYLYTWKMSAHFPDIEGP